MSEAKATMKMKRALASTIRKELGSDTNRRFLGRMQAFKLEAEIPDRLSTLLRSLDRAERMKSSRN